MTAYFVTDVVIASRRTSIAVPYSGGAPSTLDEFEVPSDGPLVRFTTGIVAWTRAYALPSGAIVVRPVSR